MTYTTKNLIILSMLYPVLFLLFQLGSVAAQNGNINLTLIQSIQIPQTTGLVAVSGLGFHPNSSKQVIVYTNATVGTFRVINAATSTAVFQGNLSSAKDFFGRPVNCQGNVSCIVGDFSNLSQEGNYYITTSFGQSHQFPIKLSVFQDTIPIFNEFFNALQQQDSSYHADMHIDYSPPFLMMADGSFIMEADQASLSLIRLGSAYRRNPSIFSSAMRDTISSYALYLQGIQGLDIQQRTDGVGFRLNPGLSIPNAFVPGPTTLTAIDVYTPGNPTPILNIPVISSCTTNGITDPACASFQAAFYKCQIDEPCLNLTYQDRTGILLSSDNGYGVSRGWGYEFGCYFDVNIQALLFSGEPNPCMIFYPDANRQYTTEALLGFLEAIPAVYDKSPVQADALFTRAHRTYTFIKNSYAPFQNGDDDAGYFGAALFLLYDYTNDSIYISEAYALANKISINFITDKTHGNEFYWEEYAKHKTAIQSAGLTYERGGNDPAEYFRNKIFGDYKSSGPTSIGNNAERIYQFDMNIQFQNSRYILMEGLFATKAIDAYPASESIIRLVADNELAWMTGQNAVQDGVALGSQLRSYSFIFGIGEFPTQFHSRYLVNSGYTSASSGKVIGMRGMGYQFKDATNSMTYFDGVSSIMGKTLGASGNGWHDETTTDPFVIGQTFNNGKTYIPGWINGVYDINTNPAENDTIFNYNDDAHAYEFTETTNEIVSTAVEYVSYLDAVFNNKAAYAPLSFAVHNTTDPILGGNINITTIPGFASVYLNNIFKGNTSTNGNLYLQNITPMAYSLQVLKNNYDTYAMDFTLNAGQNRSFNIVLQEANANATIIANSTSLPLQHDDMIGTDYHLYETDNATFNVILNTAGTITWQVDGVIVQTTQGVSDTFTWNPGILYTSDYKKATVTVRAGTQAVNWLIHVENTINPFFLSDAGAPNATVHVFTNNNYSTYRSINITLDNSGTRSTYTLNSSIYLTETDWQKLITDMPYGITYLVEIATIDNITATRHVYALTTERGHYRQPPIPLSGNINVTTSPGSASVYLNDTFKGNTSTNGNLYLPNITPSTYSLRILKNNYDTYATNFTLGAGQNSSFNITLVLSNQTLPANGSITIITSPVNASVFLDDIYRGNTNETGRLYLPNMPSGSYHLNITKQGYLNYIEIPFPLAQGQNRTVNITLQQVSINATIIANSTSLPFQHDDTMGTDYHLYETDNATFNVILNTAGTITWQVDGVIVQPTQGSADTFTWNPGIFYTSDHKKATVTASVGTQAVNWLVHAENTINPFFTDETDAAAATLHVFTNNNYSIYRSINITLDNMLTYTLDHNIQTTETDWQKYITNLPYGTTYLVKITTTDNATGQNHIYTLTTQRGHYRQPPSDSSSSPSENNRRNSGGGGGNIPRNEALDVVYAVFSQDVIQINATQTITLDANATDGKIKAVTAEITVPSGKITTVDLVLIQGSRNYGTWSANFSMSDPGLYTLSHIVLSGSTTKKTVDMTDRSFYVESDSTFFEDAHLTLINTMLNMTYSDIPSAASLTIDARDGQGITSASATLQTSRGTNVTIPLTLIKGTTHYGTWSGTIEGSISDTTYTVQSITLANRNTTQVYAVADRSFYIAAAPPSGKDTSEPGGITGSVIDSSFGADAIHFFTRQLQQPFFPAILGFALLSLFFLGSLFITNTFKQGDT